MKNLEQQDQLNRYYAALAAISELSDIRYDMVLRQLDADIQELEHEADE